MKGRPLVDALFVWAKVSRCHSSLFPQDPKYIPEWLAVVAS